MHPADAADRGISEGAHIKITSRVGEMHITVSVTDIVLKGVAHVHHGRAVANRNVSRRDCPAHAEEACPADRTRLDHRPAVDHQGTEPCLSPECYAFAVQSYRHIDEP